MSNSLKWFSTLGWQARGTQTIKSNKKQNTFTTSSIVISTNTVLTTYCRGPSLVAMVLLRFCCSDSVLVFLFKILAATQKTIILHIWLKKRFYKSNIEVCGSISELKTLNQHSEKENVHVTHFVTLHWTVNVTVHLGQLLHSSHRTHVTIHCKVDDWSDKNTLKSKNTYLFKFWYV